MRLTRLGVKYLLEVRCSFCGARPGELCLNYPVTVIEEGLRPHKHPTGWPHGVHAHRLLDLPGDGAEIKSEPMPDEELAPILMRSALLLAAP